MERRKFLRMTPVALTAGFAGCGGSGDGGTGEGSTATDSPTSSNGTPTDGSGESNEGYWPPPRNTVDTIVPVDVGTTTDTITRIWANALEESLDISASYTNQPGSSGLLAYNSLAKAEPNGGTAGTVVFNSLIPNQIGKPDVAKYDASEFIPLKIFYERIRGVQLNPDTTPVDDHFDMTWDDFVENAPYKLAGTGIHQTLTQYLLTANEPRLDESDIENVTFDSGSSARAAIKRGDLDGYTGSFASNFASDRAKIYKTQFAVVDDRYSNTVERVKAKHEEATTLQESGFPEDGLHQIVDMTRDAVAHALPPDTPDEIVQKLDEGYQTLYEEHSDSIKKKVKDTYDDVDTMYYEGSQEETAKFAQRKYKLFMDNKELVKELFKA